MFATIVKLFVYFNPLITIDGLLPLTLLSGLLQMKLILLQIGEQSASEFAFSDLDAVAAEESSAFIVGIRVGL